MGLGRAQGLILRGTGLRNSLLLAPMPTASTSQILGFNECFEPYTSNIYQRRVLAGEFQVVNPWLLKDLVELGLWSDGMKNRIIADGGSIQRIPNIPDDIKALYKTVWEISQRTVVQMAADRGAFIDQSQSLNIHMKEPTMGKITSMHFAGWKLGLKTGHVLPADAGGIRRPSSSPSTRRRSRSRTRPWRARGRRPRSAASAGRARRARWPRPAGDRGRRQRGERRGCGQRRRDEWRRRDRRCEWRQRGPVV